MSNDELLLSISDLMKKNLQPLEKRMDAFDEKIDKVEERLSARIDCLDVKIDNVEQRLTSEIKRLDSKIDNVEQNLTSEIKRLDSKIDSVEQNLHSVEQNLLSVEQNLKNDIHLINLKLENMIIPRLNEIESCYLSTSERYQRETDKFIAFDTDLSVMRGIILEHGNRLCAIGA